MPSIEEFDAYVKQLSNHDWFYAYSDDYCVWRAGKDAQERLLSKTASHESYRKAYEAHHKCAYGRSDSVACAQTIAAIRESL